jgi:hypothetical protein
MTIMFSITIFTIDSCGDANVSHQYFEKYEDALAEYKIFTDKYITHNNSSAWSNIPSITESIKEDKFLNYYPELEDSNEQYTVYLTTTDGINTYYRTYQDGSWKRPCGVELYKYDITQKHTLFVYPPHKTYRY